MRSRLSTFACLFALIACSLWARQLLASKKLSAEDEREFRKELQRLQTLLSTANDKCVIQMQIANTYAAGGEYAEAMHLLRQVVHADLGFDPSRDPDFSALRKTKEFESLLAEVRRQTPPISNSRSIAFIEKRDLFPESFAFDSKRNSFLLGSTSKDEIDRCSVARGCIPLVAPRQAERGYVLGLKIDKHSGVVWAATNTRTGAGLRAYDLETGKLKRTAQLEGKHVFNDLVISSSGVVYVTDTAGGSVYQLDLQDAVLRRIAPAHMFTGANGIALSSDDKLLYVSAWGDGIDVIALPSGLVKPLHHPANVCLAFIDGLYSIDGSLIAIQNGLMLPRIVRLQLDAGGKRVAKITILERRNPAFDGLTTGVIVGKQLYFIANSQIDKKNSANLKPLQILAVQAAP